MATTVTLRTQKVVAVAGSLGTTDRTALTRLERVNFLDADSGLFGLVGDELLQLVEVPRVDATPLASLSNPLQVLDFQDGILELFGPVDEATGGFVVEVTNPALLFVTHAVPCAKRTRFR